MAIWSLTQERVEKLLKQIGDKEAEVDELQKLSAKDIWNVDLEAFVEEWHTQQDEEHKRKKKIASMTRRDSRKLGIAGGKGKGKKKRKMGDSDDDDSGSDFGPTKKKAKPKKEGGLLSYLKQSEPIKKPSAAEALKSSTAFGAKAPTKQDTLLGHLVKSVTAGDAMDVDKPAAPAAKRGRPAAAKKPTPAPVDSEDDSDVFAAVAEEVAKKPAARNARAAAKPSYNLGSDSDSDDLLGDVSSMVKTVGTSAAAPMFKASSARPSSATGPSKAGKKASPIDLDDDETNYEGLMPQPSPERPAPRNVNDTIMGSDDDDFGIVARKPAPAKALPKAKAAAKPVPKAKAAAAPVVKKPTALSPAAKAYAAKLAKSKAVGALPAPKLKKPVIADSDEDETMQDADALADEILSDDDEPTPKPARAPAARPGRRAAAKPAKYIVSDDDDDDDDDASEASFDDDSD